MIIAYTAGRIKRFSTASVPCGTQRRSYNTGKLDVNGRHSPGTNSGAIAMRQPLTVGFQFPSYDLSPIAIGELYLRAFRLTHQVIY